MSSVPTIIYSFSEEHSYAFFPKSLQKKKQEKHVAAEPVSFSPRLPVDACVTSKYFFFEKMLYSMGDKHHLITVILL